MMGFQRERPNLTVCPPRALARKPVTTFPENALGLAQAARAFDRPGESAMLLGSLGERRSEMESPYAQQWQARARELRTQAEQMISPEAKSLMLGAADDHEHLTRITEAMALIRGVLASAIEDDESRTR
jgi:hypothetical protein